MILNHYSKDKKDITDKHLIYLILIVFVSVKHLIYLILIVFVSDKHLIYLILIVFVSDKQSNIFNIDSFCEC